MLNGLVFRLHRILKNPAVAIKMQREEMEMKQAQNSIISKQILNNLSKPELDPKIRFAKIKEMNPKDPALKYFENNRLLSPTRSHKIRSSEVCERLKLKNTVFNPSRNR